MMVLAITLVFQRWEASQRTSGKARRIANTPAEVMAPGGEIVTKVKTVSACRDGLWCFRQRLRESLHWRDARLLKHLREMSEPAPQVKDLILDPRHPPWQHRPSFNTTETFIRTLTQGQEGGVFVEVGAQDGLWLSNTWWLETERGWRGLLLESDPSNYRLLRGSARASPTLPICVTAELRVSQKLMVRTRSPKNFTRALLRAQQGRSKLAKFATPSELLTGDTWIATCYPIFSVLAAAGYSKIDLLTFDLSGGGMEMTTDFLTINHALGTPFHVKLLLYQDSQLEEFFDLQQVKDTFRRLGYLTLKIKAAHYLLYHHTISVVAV
ncbi:uncharacterized protein [Cherax quadricarinatus]|uniref:uncharacterized protein isoform X1 n=1 Tax=Cherax quadricarinatus TaxID=27406 RepID=UPI0023781308|nr:uncharacterized protein LOC128699414 isoform X1 [Cherax quadricarinatus]